MPQRLSPLLAIITAMAIFLAGLIAGWAMSSLGSKGNTLASGVKERADQNQKQSINDAAAEEQISRQAAEQAHLQIDQLKANADKAILADRVAIFKKFHMRVNDETHGSNNPISDQVMELLKITPPEEEAIKSALLNARIKNDALKSQYLTINTNTPEILSFQIAPYPEGAQLKQELDQHLGSILGLDRAEALQNLDLPSTGLPDLNEPYSVGLMGDGTITVNINYQTRQYTEAVTQSNRSSTMSGSFSGDLPGQYRNIISIAH